MTTLDPRARCWDPLLGGRLASRAWRRGLEIARRLATQDASNLHEASDATLFWAYASTVIDKPWADEAYTRAMETFANALSGADVDLSLIGGLVGAAWIEQHVSPDGEASLPPVVDGLIERALDAKPWRGTYELLGGLAGIGVYLIDRPPTPDTSTALRKVVSHIERAKTSTELGDAWWTKPEELSGRMRVRFPNGCYDLGVAHGAAGIIAFYSAALEARDHQVDAERLQTTVASATRFVLSHTQKNSRGIRVPGAVAEPGDSGLRKRNAWCYGDLGVCVALARASVVIGDKEISERIRRLSHGCARGSLEDGALVGWGLCHGSAGTAHTLNRLRSHFHDDHVIVSGARRCFAHLLDGLDRDSSLPVGERPSCILTGSAGVGLALFAAVTDLAPSWDRRMLLDV